MATWKRGGPVQPLSRFHARIAVLAVAMSAIAALTAGSALAQSIPIGTGVVVIKTNLAYQGGGWPVPAWSYHWVRYRPITIDPRGNVDR